MVEFEDIQDVEEWLAPLDYIDFWSAIAPYRLGLDDRPFCDGLIAGGNMTEDKLLDTLKALAVMELTAIFDLRDRIRVPLAAQYLTSVH